MSHKIPIYWPGESTTSFGQHPRIKGKILPLTFIFAFCIKMMRVGMFVHQMANERKAGFSQQKNYFF